MGFKNTFKSLFNVEDEYEYVEEEVSYNDELTEGTEAQKNVVSLKSMKQPTSKVVLCEPRTYNEAQEIADHIVNRRAVVINLERVSQEQARRIVDFLSGTVYAVNGDIQKLGAQTFLCTPDNVEITGSISDSYSVEDETERGW